MILFLGTALTISFSYCPFRPSPPAHHFGSNIPGGLRGTASPLSKTRVSALQGANSFYASPFDLLTLLSNVNRHRALCARLGVIHLSTILRFAHYLILNTWKRYLII